MKVEVFLEGCHAVGNMLRKSWCIHTVPMIPKRVTHTYALTHKHSQVNNNPVRG